MSNFKRPFPPLVIPGLPVRLRRDPESREEILNQVQDDDSFFCHPGPDPGSGGEILNPARGGQASSEPALNLFQG